MNDLISRADALEIIKRTSGDYATAFCNVRDLPTINPEDLRPRGRWKDELVRDWHCSECGEKLRGNGWDGYIYKNLPNYCPNCGAKMTEES